MKKSGLFMATLGALMVFVLFLSAYTVNEVEQVVITQFGKPVGEPVMAPGIHFKVPFMQTANYFDKRFLEWDGDPNQVPTKDKRFIWVDTTARWRISDPLLFFQRLRDIRSAQSRLDDILDGAVRNSVANHTLLEIVRSSNREVQKDDLSAEEEDLTVFEKITYGRDKIRQEILDSSVAPAEELGIEILDFRIKRLNYVNEVRQKVYDRMISERERIADKYRSEGQGEASRIRGEKNRDLKQIQSEAYRQAQEIKGRADAEATRIYADAYNSSPEARSYYEFIKTMETYENTLDANTWLFLGTEGDFYQYLQDINGN